MNLAQQILLLCEGNYSGLLYHATEAESVPDILASGELMWGRGTGIAKHISFSRSKNYWFRNSHFDARLVLDGDKLSQDYKLTPYVGKPQNNIDPHHFGKQPGKYFEYELEVRKPITNLQRYLVGIEINREPPYSHDPSDRDDDYDRHEDEEGDILDLIGLVAQDNKYRVSIKRVNFTGNKNDFGIQMTKPLYSQMSGYKPKERSTKKSTDPRGHRKPFTFGTKYKEKS